MVIIIMWMEAIHPNSHHQLINLWPTSLFVSSMYVRGHRHIYALYILPASKHNPPRGAHQRTLKFSNKDITRTQGMQLPCSASLLEAIRRALLEGMLNHA